MINVAIIGTGSIAESHIKAFLAFPDRCRLTAFVSRKSENAAAKALKFGVEVEIVDSYRELLDRDDIHLVSICTPPYTHAEMTIDFLKAKKHVILEKPMALSLEECDSMLKAAEENNRILSVIAQNRFTEPMAGIKKVIEEGLIGDILHAQIDSYSWRGSSYFDLWWRGTWEKEGGGSTINQGIHHIDMLNWIMGMPEEITAVISNATHENSELEDISISILKYGNGALGQITTSIIHHGEEKRMIFQGRKAKVSFPWSVYASKAKGNGFPLENTELEKQLQQFYENLPQLVHSKHDAQIDDVLSAIEKGTQPVVDGIDGRNALEVVTAIYKSASLGTPVKLPISKNDLFYSLKGILESVPRFHEKSKSLESLPDEGITT